MAGCPRWRSCGRPARGHMSSWPSLEPLAAPRIRLDPARSSLDNALGEPSRAYAAAMAITPVVLALIHAGAHGARRCPWRSKRFSSARTTRRAARDRESGFEFRRRRSDGIEERYRKFSTSGGAHGLARVRRRFPDGPNPMGLAPIRQNERYRRRVTESTLCTTSGSVQEYRRSNDAFLSSLPGAQKWDSLFRRPVRERQGEKATRHQRRGGRWHPGCRQSRGRRRTPRSCLA
jgi:hypothetical protein